MLRACAVLSRAHARDLHVRFGRRRHVLVSVLMVVTGLAGAVGGGALVGRWCLGLVVMAEAGGLIWFGLARDDGVPQARRGTRTVGEVLEDERARL